ncbi:uncharacterized protein LOC119603409 [Lucilia sericata]|uniref:uncharacterized protein LOC119603409 n=1 Tax=Lucilia sericata TaxID=13632 RepID=UPI0018A882CC|nr:uncharacterized protein LOC119603409 [Lucilia sericata]
MGDKKFVQDYTLVCRTCLQGNVELLNLSALISDNIHEENTKISYLECLKMCIQLEETLDIEMPQKICLECASALQVAYWFMKNASQAQELLKLKLREIKRKKQQFEMELAAEVRKPKRYRCKICNVKVETKRSLKDHVKLHLDIIVYNCQMCSFESHNRNGLAEHYIQVHGIEATKEQLKPKTKTSATTSSSSYIATSTAIYCNQEQMMGAIKNEHFQILPEDAQQQQQTSYETFNTNTTCDTGSLQMSTIITTAQPNFNTFNALVGDQLNNITNTADLGIANEFMVMPDGSLEKVMNKGVVIEYINTPNNASNITLDNGLDLDNIIQMQNMDNSVIMEPQNDIAQMDVDDLIIEDPGEVLEEAPEPIPPPLEEDIIPVTIIEQPKKIICKICTKDFTTQEQLKNHMLTHNEIPHFFCDQCKFYTFFKIDLHQHYKSKHNLQPTNKQLQPKNKQKTPNEFYACDLCFYETDNKPDMKTHYKVKHNIEANEIHLKPTKVEKLNTKLSPLTAKAKAAAIVSKATTATTSKNLKIRLNEETTPDYPNGLNCRKCHEVFYWRNKLYEHYKLHNAEEAALKQEKQYIKVQNKPTTAGNLYQNKTKSSPKTQTIQTQSVTQALMETNQSPSYSSLDSLTALNVSTPNNTTLNAIAPLTPSSSSTYTLPSDAIPQIVETEQTIENDMDFDFNGDDDALFGDFDDDVDVENDSDDNDTEFRNISLTSDDDFDDMLQEQNNLNSGLSTMAPNTSQSYCSHCQKSFLSQYQFENHMFVHRGLAPYRCEMCTNLYNTKRCLIRHYKAVHKSVPTRDMIQAKGDKVCEDKTPVEHLKLEESTSLMCAKCPFESAELAEIKFHLNSSHNISDDSYIMKKLPYECPRCIRSFASKAKILRHLQRNHSSIPINQHQIRFENNDNTISTMAIAATATNTTSAIITNQANMMNTTETTETNASCGYSDVFIKQEAEPQQQQQQQHYSYTDNKLSIENAITPNIIMANYQDTNSSTTSLAYNETFNNSIDNSPLNQHMPTSSLYTASTTALDIKEEEEESKFNQLLYKCKICLTNCYNLESFNEHSKRIDCRKLSLTGPDDRMLFECEICHCNYKTMYLLKHHLKRHIGRKFLCANCPKTFINKIELEAHKHVHSGERPHKCDACTKSFRYIHHLKRHKDSVHYGKRHVCTMPNCGRKFTTLAQLKVHIWTHNGIVPYKCPFCQRLFKKRLLLREHCLKIHNVNLSEEEMAEIFRNSLGYTNPHDFTVTIGNGKMLRRGDLETMGASGVIKSSFK